MADANIFQGAIFHDNAMEDVNRIESTEFDSQMGNGENGSRPMETNPKQTKFTPKPAAHRVLEALSGISFLKLICDVHDVQRMSFILLPKQAFLLCSFCG